MKSYSGRIIGNKYGTAGESIICNGTSYHIDRTHAARTWCIEKGMSPAFSVTAGKESFVVYAGTIRATIGGTMEAAFAIPA